jgi:ankyrin repeat protein/organic hydroperoxide reductase OsmC/OhrA
LSIALASTLGVLGIAFFWLLVGKFIVGVLYPIVTIGLMFGLFRLSVKSRESALDPRHMSLQLGVIGGGYISTVIFYFASGMIPPKGLLYCGGGMAFLALLTIGLDQIKVARLNNAAEKAWIRATEARRLTIDGDTKSADEILQEALLTSEIAYGSGHPQVATIVFYMAELMRKMSRTEAATVLYRRAVLVRSALTENVEQYVLTMQACADHMRDAGLHDEALSVITKAVAESKKLENSRALTGRCSLTLSRIHTAKDNLQEAYDAGCTAAKFLEASQGKSHPETLLAKALVANHCVTLGRVAEAERILVEVVAEKEKLGENDDATYLDLLLDLSAVHSRGNLEKSKLAMLKAVKLYRSHVGPGYYRAEDLLEKLPAVLADGAIPEMQEYYEKMFAKETRAASLLLEDTPQLATTVDASGWTTLQWAVFFDNAELTRVSLSQGGDIEAGKDVDYPPLYIGTRWANRASLSTLFRKDPDVEIQAVDGSRPIHGAVLSGDQLTFDQTLSKKADPQVANKLGWTPLHLVAFKGDRKFLLQLIPKGADVNFQAPSSMQTPLHAAILGGQRGAAETLLLNMAQVDLEDCNGDTAADLAAKLGNKDILELMEGYTEPEIHVTSVETADGEQVALDEAGSPIEEVEQEQKVEEGES